MSTEKQVSSAWYALRRTLPLWSFEKCLGELTEYLGKYRVDELIVKVDTEEFWHGQPSLEWIKRYQPLLFQVKDELARLGVHYSLNPWVTLGHCDRGRNSLAHLPGLQTIVGHDGLQCTSCACPLGDVWRENTTAVWTHFAETRPKVLWIEDDIRTFNHPPVRFGCFCPLHLKRFSQQVDQPVTRERLVAAILQPGKPHPWRVEYLDMQAKIMTEVAGLLATTIHTISPQTSLGLMSSGPRLHCLEGRQWSEFCRALADGRPLYSRPPMGNYDESSLRGFYYSHDSIKITRHCVPKGAIEQTEVENIPFSRYSKSVAFTFLQMAISFAYGSHGITLNLFDHCGTPMQDEPWYGKMLADKKPFLNALAEKAQVEGNYRGVRLLHHERFSCSKRLEQQSDYGRLCEDGAVIMELLESHGIPTTFEDSEVVAVCGQQLQAYSDEELLCLLKRGLLLDGRAAKVLFDRGFGKEIGLQSLADPVNIDSLQALAAEEFFNRSFGGENRVFLTLTLPNLGCRPNLSVAHLASEAEVISALVDPDTVRRYPAMYAYENKLGGRVVVHLLDLASAYGISFHHPHRHQQLHGVIRWLCRGQFPLFVKGGVYPLTFRKDLGSQTLLGLFNLTLDAWKQAEFECTDHRRARKVEMLKGNSWSEDLRVRFCHEVGKIIIQFDGDIPFDRPLFLCVKWRSEKSHKSRGEK